jgi:general secretion pathway protein G
MQVRRATRAVAARRGFTLMEILVVVAIIVMLAGLSGYYVMQRYEDAKLSDARIKVKMIGDMVQQYRLQNGDQYPPSLEALTQPGPLGSQPYSDMQGLMDPWGKPFQYDPAGQHNNGLKPDVWTTTPNGGTIGNWAGGS